MSGTRRGDRGKRGSLPTLALLLPLAACQPAAPAEPASLTPTSSATPSSSARGPYVGLANRQIRALSAQEVADLLEGRGAGYALAAELNHYPGPLHVLELADQLGLTEQQRQQTRALRAQVQERAKRLGRELVDLEAELDASFREGRITHQLLSGLTSQIAEVDGQLRSTHLEAHLRMKELLTPEQVRRYDQLRGYASDGSPAETFHPHGSGHAAP